jgi:hypothetical protein
VLDLLGIGTLCLLALTIGLMSLLARSPKSRYGSQRAALTRPTSVAEALRVTAVRICRASPEIWEPNADTAEAVQKRGYPGTSTRRGMIGP